MMQAISHQQAQAYIHAVADKSLDPDEKDSLEAHLLDCANCRVYAEEFANLENTLRKTLGNRWNVAPRPLALDRVLDAQKAALHPRLSAIVATPILALFLVMFAMVMTHTSTFDGNQTTAPSVTALATIIPTPTGELPHTIMVDETTPTSTTVCVTATNTCAPFRYTIQPGDTLSSIAEKFGVSMQAIRDANPFPGADVLDYELIIPICNPTSDSVLTDTPSFTPTSYLP